jgi:nitric oxide dioxygenase
MPQEKVAMTPEQIAIVQTGFRKVAAIRDTAAHLFYERLFELDPGLRHLFHGDMEQQGQKLMMALSLVVRGLNDLERILPMVRELGRRHAGYGVDPRHYETVGAALIWTLEQGLGDDFTDDALQAWAAAYDLLSSTMIEAGTRQAA